MKRNIYLVCTLLVASLFLFNPQTTYAIAGQWSANGSNVYYNDGRIGIGTSSPQAKLDIWDPNSQNTLKLNGPTWSTLTHDSIGNYSMYQSNGSVVHRFDSDNNDGESYIAFQRHTGAFIMTIKATSGGQVGIGTTKPTRLLSVNGTVLAKEVLVTSAAQYWPDYVFEDNYNLMSLKDLNEFIKDNKHLPGIPSEKSIETNGISVGEMQRLQMEKIEELTLHAIHQESKISELERNNLELRLRLQKLEELIK